MLARDHYATLGVPPNADLDEIEAAYRHLSRRYHPGVNPGDRHAAQVYERLEEAYRVLADPERRARYDREGSLVEAQRVEQLGLRVQLLPSNDGQGSYRELLSLLRDHGKRSAGARGADIQTTVTVPLEHAERGRRARVEVRRERRCDACGGRGRVRLRRTRPCERCAGEGQETFIKGPLSVACACSECGGEGLVSGARCGDCSGRGVRSRQEMMLVRIPPGVIDGQEVRVPGEGSAGLRGGVAGDLVVRCQVQTVAGYERQGPHLRTEAPISIEEAVFGGRVLLQDLYGQPMVLRLPPNTAGGRVFRVKGHGLELPDGRRGDMLVRVQVQLPEIVDEESKALVRQLGRRHPYDPRTAPRSDQ